MSYYLTPYQASAHRNIATATSLYPVDTDSNYWANASVNSQENDSNLSEYTNWEQIESDFLSNSGRHASPSYSTTFSSYVPISPSTPISPSQSNASQSPLPRRRGSNDFSISVQKPSNDKKEKRRVQNRDSQRAYRERTRKKEGEMAAIIAKLHAEIDGLRQLEKSSSEIIEALSAEVERLRGMGLIFEWNGI